MVDVGAARSFLTSHGRILERRLAECLLDRDESAALAVIAALEAYSNPDGGLGHGLEPDVLAPDSQPLAVDFAFDILTEIAIDSDDPFLSRPAGEAMRSMLGYLDQVADASGGLSIVLPSVAHHPRAEHWGDGVFPPALNPTAKIVGNARAAGVDHPWLDRAGQFCWSMLSRADTVADAHTALCVLRFLETDPDQDRSRPEWEGVGARLSELALFQPMPGEGYGLTPLDFAPDPHSTRRKFFTEEAIRAHLDALAAEQATDGGWPISWTAASPAAELAWRGFRTVQALRVLTAYGR